MTHPARAYDFDTLITCLRLLKEEGLVRENVGQEGLRLFCYTEKCVYERAWNPLLEMARGLILDENNKKIVATPFPKFFNYGENSIILPNEPFEVFEKLDGSLIIIFFHKGKWACATKGSLSSDQAKWAENWIKDKKNLHCLTPGITYLCEAIYPENKIVVNYPYTGLSLLGGYHEDGEELTRYELETLSDDLGWKICDSYTYNSLEGLVEVTSKLSSQSEGFVVRFENGHRVKVKGDEYCRIHRLVTRLTPLAVWEAMLAGDDLEVIRKDLPEEFWVDFDKITELLKERFLAIQAEVRVAAEELKSLSDKEVGLRLGEFTDVVRKFIFPYRKNEGNLLHGRSRKALFSYIRPDGNFLEGYTPSSIINQLQEGE